MQTSTFSSALRELLARFVYLSSNPARGVSPGEAARIVDLRGEGDQTVVTDPPRRQIRTLDGAVLATWESL